MRLFAVVLLTLFGAGPTMAAETAGCSGSSKVAAEIEAIASRWNIDVDPTTECRTAALCALAEKSPDSMVAQIACQDARTMGQEGLEAERRRTSAAHAANPASPTAWFLWARLLPDDEAGREADAFVAREPGSPWGFLIRAKVEANRRGAVRRDELSTALDAFQSRCPETTLGYAYANALEPSAAASFAARLRKALLEKPLAAPYPTLWQLEFKAAPASSHDDVRKRLRSDLSRLETRIAADPDRAWILLSGHDLLGDAAARAVTEDLILEAIPGSYQAFQIEDSRYERVNPGWEAKAAFEASSGWIVRWKDYPIPWLHRLNAIRDLPEIPDGEAIRTGEGLLRALKLRPLDVHSFRPLEIQVAEIWISRGVRLREIPALAGRAVAETERHLRARARYTRTDYEQVVDEARWLGDTLTVEALARTGRHEAAAKRLAAMEAGLAGAIAGLEPLAAAHRRSCLERARAGLALAEGDDAGALDHYRASIRCFAEDTRKMAEPAEALRRAKKLLPRTDDAFVAEWLAGAGTGPAPASLVAFERRDRVLPKAALRAADGTTVTIPDSKGRVVVAVLWATWCGPCHGELPFVQKLHERLLGSEKAALVTLSIDESPALVAPFLRERRYTFPALFAKDYVEALPERGFSVPRTWIVSPDGRVLLESQAFIFGEKYEDWLARMEAALASVTGSGGP